jgi:hypothetical protein
MAARWRRNTHVEQLAILHESFIDALQYAAKMTKQNNAKLG